MTVGGTNSRVIDVLEFQLWIFISKFEGDFSYYAIYLT